MKKVSTKYQKENTLIQILVGLNKMIALLGA